MRAPPPSYPPPPPPLSGPAGYTVTLCGPPQTVLQQQRLLPLSQSILCLPALKWTPPTQIHCSDSNNNNNSNNSSHRVSSSSKRRSSTLNPRLSRSSTQSSTRSHNGGGSVSTLKPLRPPTLDQLKLSVLKLHEDYIKRHETAREFLEAPRTLTGSDRRIVFYNGGERDVKQVCIDGIRQTLRDDEEEIEKLWTELMDTGVEGLLNLRDGERKSKKQEDGANNSNHHQSVNGANAGGSWPDFHSSTESAASDTTNKNSKFARLELNIDVQIPKGQFSPIATTCVRTSPFTATAFPSSSDNLNSPTSPTDYQTTSRRYSRSRSRGSGIVRNPPSVAETDETENETETEAGRSSDGCDGGGAHDESEPERRSHRLDSAYSSGVDSIPTPSPPVVTEVRPSQIAGLNEFRFKDKNSSGKGKGKVPSSSSRSPSPTPSSEAGTSGHVISPKQIPADFEAPPVEPLFPSLREDLTIILWPDVSEEMRDPLIQKLLGNPTVRDYAAAASRSPSPSRRYTVDASPVSSPKPTQLSFRYSLIPFKQSVFHPSTTLAPQTIHLLSEKSALEVQNEVRALLTKYIPPANNAETPTSLEFPGATKWLLDSEAELFGPLMSGGFEGLPEALCPSLDMIVAVGGDGRESLDTSLTDETERQSSALSRKLSESIERLGGRGNADTRGVRAALRCVLRGFLPFMSMHPGTTLEDIAAGHFILPCLESYVKVGRDIRLFVLDFDLKTGCQAVLSLKAILPPDMFKLIVVGEAATGASSTHGHGNRIYVRTSVGKTTMSFSALPSPLMHEKHKIRRLESAKMSVLARADFVASPWKDRDIDIPITLVRNVIRERRIVCGVINPDTVRNLTSGDPDYNMNIPLVLSSPPSPRPLSPQLPERQTQTYAHTHTPSPNVVRLGRAPSPELYRRYDRSPSPKVRRGSSTSEKPLSVSAPLRNTTPIQNYAMRNSPPLPTTTTNTNTTRVPSPSLTIQPPQPTPSPPSSSGGGFGFGSGCPRKRRGSSKSSERKPKPIPVPPPPSAPSAPREPIRIQVTPCGDPHPGVMMPLGRRDSDTNSHGGGVSISSPTQQHTPVTGGMDWREGSYYEDECGIADLEDDSDDLAAARPARRKGSKALRWLGLET